MSLFESTPGNDPTGEVKAPSQAPVVVDQLLAGIKNEKGEQKYSSVEEAIKGLAHAQEFINTLKTEKAQLEGMVKSQEQLKELFNKPPVKEVVTEQVAVGITPEQVVTILEQREQLKVAAANRDKVKAALQEALGAEYKTVLAAKTDQLGLTRELVDNMAKTAPDALLKLLDIKAPAVKPSLKNSVMPEGFKPGEKPAKKKFNPLDKTEDKGLTKWRESAARTNARLGLEN